LLGMLAGEPISVNGKSVPLHIMGSAVSLSSPQPGRVIFWLSTWLANTLIWRDLVPEAAAQLWHLRCISPY